MTDRISSRAIRAGLENKLVGRKIVYLEQTTSTNDEARRLAEAGAPEGTVVVADYQSAGRGRQGRTWQAPFGSCLLLSVVFRPSVPPDQVQRLTMTAGLAVVDAIEERTGLHADLKWPNDIIIRGQKLGGILTEVGVTRSRVDFVVLGIGLNVNLDPVLLSGELISPATSLSAEVGRDIPRLPLLRSLLERLEERYLHAGTGNLLVDEWAQRLTTIGQRVAVTLPDGALQGVATGVDERGALLVRTPDERLVPILAGDVMVSA